MTELIKKYQQLKEKKVVNLAKIGDAYAIAFKKFDPDTGEELSDEVVSVDLEQLEKRKEELESEIENIDTFIKDCQKLK